MLSAHGSAPEVVAAAQARGSYVVDSVCPLVTKVHHEVRVRAGKGYRIVYVGHEGHEEAVGTMAVAPDAISRVESVADVAALPRVRRARRPARPDHAVAIATGSGVAVAVRERFPDVWTPGRSDLCFATTNRQSALMAARRALRRDRRHRLGQLVQHAGAREAGARGRLSARRPRQRSRARSPTSCSPAPASSASRPARRHPTSSSSRSSRGWLRVDGVEVVAVTDEDEYFPPPRNLRELQAAIEAAATVMLGGSTRRTGRAMDDRALSASDVLAAPRRLTVDARQRSASGQLRGTWLQGTSRSTRTSPGRPSTRSPRMFFITSVVPPSIELARLRRNAFCGVSVAHRRLRADHLVAAVQHPVGAEQVDDLGVDVLVQLGRRRLADRALRARVAHLAHLVGADVRQPQHLGP